MTYKKPRAGKGSTYHQRYTHRLDPADNAVVIPAGPSGPPPEHMISPLETRPAWRTDRPGTVPPRDLIWASLRYRWERMPAAPTRSIYQFVSDAFYRISNGWVG